jgi:hypothetical protein
VSSQVPRVPDEVLKAAIAVPVDKGVMAGVVPVAIATPEVQQFEPPDHVTRHWPNCPVAPLNPTATLPSLSGATVGLEPEASTHPWLAQFAGPVDVS